MYFKKQPIHKSQEQQTFFNAGKYFDSDWDNNLIITKPYTLCHEEKPGYKAILKQLYCHRYTTGKIASCLLI